MREFSLNDKQKQLLEKYGEDYKKWIETSDGIITIQEHRTHESYFKQKLSAEKLDSMSEQEFAEIYKKLWASNIWGDKDQAVKSQLIEKNGLEKTKVELKKLIYGSNDLVNRYNELRKNITGFGVSTLSEILHFLFPDKYCLWNDKPKTVLPFLGLDILPNRFFKYQISTGQEYLQCVQYLDIIKRELARFGVRDFIDLDIFFWHIFKDIIPKSSQTIKEPLKEEKSVSIVIDSHESAEYYILELGRILGYLTYTVDQSKTFNGKKLGEAALLKEIPAFAGERDLNSAREIDAIWFGDDENPKYCFEIEHTTDIVHGLNRLTQLQHLRVKFIIAASEDRRTKFEIEMTKYPYRRMKEWFGFISYDELAALYETSVPFYKLKTKLLGP
jgi:hypothetical protein